MIKGIVFNGKVKEIKPHFESLIAIYGKSCPVWYVLKELYYQKNKKRGKNENN